MKPAPVLAALAAVLLPLAALAADDDSLVEVFAVGSGLTQETAMKAANKAAVEQVVGTIIDATTRVENDELVEDRILTYSAGLIADSKIVGTPKSADGLITVKVKATVKKTALKEKLVAAKLISVELDGESLWAQMVSAQDNLADAEAMIKDVLSKHLACVVAEAVPGKTGKSPLDLDPKTGEVFANVRVRIDQEKYKQFAKDILDKLGPMSVREAKSDCEYNDSYESSFKVAVKSSKNGDARPQALLLLENPKAPTVSALFFDSNKEGCIRNHFLSRGYPAIRVSLLNGDRDEIGHGVSPVVKNVHPGTWWCDACCLFSGSYVRDRNFNPVVITPFLGYKVTSDFSSYNDTGLLSIWWYPGSFPDADRRHPPVERRFRVSLGSFTADELKTAGKLEIKVGHMKDGQFVE